jgi:hypothetical protein
MLQTDGQAFKTSRQSVLCSRPYVDVLRKIAVVFIRFGPRYLLIIPWYRVLFQELMAALITQKLPGFVVHKMLLLCSLQLDRRHYTEQDEFGIIRDNSV